MKIAHSLDFDQCRVPRNRQTVGWTWSSSLWLFSALLAGVSLHSGLDWRVRCWLLVPLIVLLGYSVKRQAQKYRGCLRSSPGLTESSNSDNESSNHISKSECTSVIYQGNASGAIPTSPNCSGSTRNECEDTGGCQLSSQMNELMSKKGGGSALIRESRMTTRIRLKTRER